MVLPYRVAALLRRVHVRAAFWFDEKAMVWRWRKTDIVPKWRWDRQVTEATVKRSSMLRAYWGRVKGIQKIVPELTISEVRRYLKVPEKRRELYELMEEREYETPKVVIGW